MGPIQKDVDNPVLFRFNQDALIFASGSIAFEFINGECLREPIGRRIADAIQELADCLDGYTSKFCYLFYGKGLAK